MAGFRTFATGEVLTAANVNDFLMKQSVMVFADATARTAALGAEVAEGMLTYNEDTEQLEVYDGTNFVLAAPEPPAGIGSNVVQTVKTDSFSTTSTGFGDVTGLTVSITPSLATSKVLVFATISGGGNDRSQASVFRLVRNSTSIAVGTDGSTGFMVGSSSGTDSQRMLVSAAVSVLDNPATASSVTYKVQQRMTGAETGFVNRSGNNNARGVSSITAIEVAA